MKGVALASIIILAAASEDSTDLLQTKLRTSPIACGPVCMIWCEHGNVMDENGCATCACNPAPEPEFDCVTCPHGFNDGCNDCYCDVTGASHCTERACGLGDLSKPRCLCPPVCTIHCEHGNVMDDNGCPLCQCNPAPELDCTTCPAGFHDGCNDCNCGAGGIPFCTERACGQGELGTPRCLQTCPPVCAIHCDYGNVLDENGCATCACNDPPVLRNKPTVNCETCPYGYNDGCNDCTCGVDGVPGCTKKACIGETPPPSCNPPPAMDCETCPYGYNDGCNDCTCGLDGVAGCTKKACIGETPPPSCNDDPQCAKAFKRDATKCDKKRFKARCPKTCEL